MMNRVDRKDETEKNKAANALANAHGADAPVHVGGTEASGGFMNIEATEDLTQISALQPTNETALGEEAQQNVTDAAEETAGMNGEKAADEAAFSLAEPVAPEDNADGLANESVQEVYGPVDRIVRLTPEMSKALTDIKRGKINSVSEEVLKELDALAKKSPGMAAALGVLTSGNWGEFAYQDQSGEWKEKTIA